MDTVFDWEQPEPASKRRKKKPSNRPAPIHLQEHNGRLMIDRFGVDWMLREGRLDIQAEAGLDYWITNKHLAKLLAYDSAASTVCFDTARNKVVRRYDRAVIPLHHTPALAAAPAAAWDPVDRLAWALDPAKALPLGHVKDLVRWAYRFMDLDDEEGLAVDAHGMARVHASGPGPLYQAMPGWPAMRLRREHLGLLLSLVSSTASTKRADMGVCPVNFIRVVQATIGASSTPYWVFHLLPSPSFLAVRCRAGDGEQVVTPTVLGDPLVIVRQDLLVGVCRRILRPCGEHSITLATEAAAGEQLLTLGTPDLADARMSIPIEQGAAGIDLLRVPQASFCKAVAAAMNPCKRIGFYLSPDRSRLVVASVNLADLQDYAGASVDRHISRVGDVGIQALDLSETGPVATGGVALEMIP